MREAGSGIANAADAGDVLTVNSGTAPMAPACTFKS
jgi:hypothetical protein